MGVKSRDPFPHRTFLVDVAASSSTDAVAVGTTESESFVERWNGTAWHVQPSADLGTGSNSLSGVDASSSTNAWAVGNYSTAQSGGEVRPLSVRWGRLNRGLYNAI